MGRKNFNSYLKKQKADKRKKKKAEKQQKKAERKEGKDQPSSWEDMIAYVDEDGNIVSEQPGEEEEAREAGADDKAVSRSDKPGGDSPSSK